MIPDSLCRLTRRNQKKNIAIIKSQIFSFKVRTGKKKHMEYVIFVSAQTCFSQGVETITKNFYSDLKAP